MGFGEAIKVCFNKYVDFSGRARRSEYWWFYLFCILVNLVLGWIPIVGFIISLGLLLPSLAALIRRLHDINRSGWWCLGFYGVMILGMAVGGTILASGAEALGVGIMVLSVIAVIVWSIVWLASDGTPGPNRFGEDPKGRMDVEEVFS